MFIKHGSRSCFWQGRFLAHCVLASVLLIGTACNVDAEEIVSESFAYDPGPQEPFYIYGTGWDPATLQWNFWTGGNVADADLIAEGSLEYTDSEGKVFPVQGNRLENNTEGGVLGRRTIGLSVASLAGAVVSDVTGGDSDEQSVPGFGNAGGEVWFSFLVGGEGSFDIRLDSTVYNQDPAGVSFRYAPGNGTLAVGQHWWTKTDYDDQIRTSIANFPPANPSLVVARLQFGPNWGKIGDGKLFDTRNAESAATRGEPTGTMTVWINPSLGAAPDPATAAAECQLVEFRFNRVYVSLAPGAAVDEIRLGATFESLVAPVQQ